MDKSRKKSYDELSEIEKADLSRFSGGSMRDYSRPDPRRNIQDEFSAPYNATEDLPPELQGVNLDKAYDKYAEQSPVHGNWLRLKRMIGRTLAGGKEK